MSSEPVGIVPAAGYARRLQPLAGSKEVLRIRGRPMLLHLVDRMRAAGAARIRVVTRASKDDVIELAVREGLEIAFAEPPTVTASLLAGLRGLPNDPTVLVGFPDSIWEPWDAYRRLDELVARGAPLALGCFRSGEPASGDVVETDAAGHLAAIHIKPERPPSDLIWGAFATRASTLATVHATEELGTFLVRLTRLKPVLCVTFGRILDIGTPQGLEAARTDPLATAPPGSGWISVAPGQTARAISSGANEADCSRRRSSTSRPGGSSTSS